MNSSTGFSSFQRQQTQAVEVEMVQVSRAAVQVHQHVGGADHFVDGDAQGRSQSLDEDRLSRPEFAADQDDLVAAQQEPELSAQGQGLLRSRGKESEIH